jgi:hypothetical protein
VDFADSIRIWADTLTHKHECGDERAIRATISAHGEASPLEVWIPDFLDEPRLMEFRAVSRFGDLMVLVARHESEDPESEYDEPRCFLMIARRHEDGSYRCVVYHEMYFPALEHLGLVDATIPSTITAVIHEPLPADSER